MKIRPAVTPSQAFLGRKDTLVVSVNETPPGLRVNGSRATEIIPLPPGVDLPGPWAHRLKMRMMSIDEFIIAYFTAGAGQASTTLPMQIYAMIRFGVTPEINAMASVVMVVSFVMIFTAQRLNRGRIPGA